eukprot:9470906-Pyramimonas_sp.AAC.1
MEALGLLGHRCAGAQVAQKTTTSCSTLVARMPAPMSNEGPAAVERHATLVALLVPGQLSDVLLDGVRQGHPSRPPGSFCGGL